jgi:ATP-binding cassette subfamily B protein
MPLGYTQAEGSGFLKNLIVDEVEKLEYPLAHNIPETTSNLLLPGAVVGVLFFMDWRMALAAFLPAAITLLLYLPMYVGIMNEFVGTYFRALENMNAKVIEYISGIKEIKIFNRAEEAATKYEESIDHYRNSTLRLYRKMWRITSPTFVLLSSVLVSVLCVGGFLYCRREITPALYILAIFMSLGVGSPLLKFIEYMDNFFEIKNGKRLVETILSESELIQTEEKLAAVKKYEIAFHDVSFSYDDRVVLEDISLVINENQKTAFVGPSGSGKTTLANLIARFWDVGSGSITLGGIDIRKIPLSQLMELITYVSQDTFLFNISILENIRLGRPDASDDEIHAAAEAAQCTEFISKLEMGYDTIAGDAGAKLSSGQRQRIVIARAILKDSPILVLDEATAYADMENQRKIQESLRALCMDKTLIIIAHRLSTVTDCDKLVVIDRGKIDSSGVHADLLVKSKLYGKMWATYRSSEKWSVKEGSGVETC